MIDPLHVVRVRDDEERVCLELFHGHADEFIRRHGVLHVFFGTEFRHHESRTDQADIDKAGSSS